SEAARDGEVDAAAAAGDERILAGEQVRSKHFGHQPSKDGRDRRRRKPARGAKSLKVVSLASMPRRQRMNRSVVIVALFALSSSCAVALNTGGTGAATESSLMQADRDLAVATHARGIDGWMSFYASDAIRIRYRDNMVKGFDEIRKFDLPNISDTTTILNWEPTDAWVYRDGSTGATTGRYWVVGRKT